MPSTHHDLITFGTEDQSCELSIGPVDSRGCRECYFVNRDTMARGARHPDALTLTTRRISQTTELRCPEISSAISGTTGRSEFRSLGIADTHHARRPRVSFIKTPRSSLIAAPDRRVLRNASTSEFVVLYDWESMSGPDHNGYRKVKARHVSVANDFEPGVVESIHCGYPAFDGGDRE